MKFVIMDYSSCYIETFTEELKDAETPEDVLVRLGYKLSEISWMCTDEENIPVFYRGEAIPFTSL